MRASVLFAIWISLSTGNFTAAHLGIGNTTGEAAFERSFFQLSALIIVWLLTHIGTDKNNEWPWWRSR